MSTSSKAAGSRGICATGAGRSTEAQPENPPRSCAGVNPVAKVKRKPKKNVSKVVMLFRGTKDIESILLTTTKGSKKPRSDLVGGHEEPADRRESGGLPDLGATAWATAIREAKEEINYDLTPCKIIDSRYYQLTEHRWNLAFVWCPGPPAEIQLSAEHTAAKTVPFRELFGHLAGTVHEPQRKWIKEYFRDIANLLNRQGFG